MATPITITDPESIAVDLTVTFDEDYLQSVLDEFNAENAKQLSLGDAKDFLARYMVDNAYYSFKDWLNGESQ